MAKIELRSLVKFFGALQVVHDVDLEIADKELLVLVGPSGCGKSTILRMIAGLEDITGGEILIDERRINDVPPRHRDIAMVFQDYALYPHMSVWENVSFGLRMRRFEHAEIDGRVAEAARVLKIDNLLDRRPGQMSGGQRQRVAMGRAMVRRPKAFLFDEPLSNLDAKLRAEMRTEIRRLHRALETTMVYVTHDQVEAMTMADRIVVLREGVVEQVGDPETLYERPANVFVAGFIGAPSMNLLPGELVGANGSISIRLSAELSLPIPSDFTGLLEKAESRSVILGIRPEKLHWRPAGTAAASPDEICIESRADVIETLGPDTLVFCRIENRDLVARMEPGTVREVGAPLTLRMDVRHLHLFDAASERRIN